MPVRQSVACISFAAFALAFVACGSGADTDESASTTVAPSPEPSLVSNPDPVASCAASPEAVGKVRIVAHDDESEGVVASVQDALAVAVDHGEANYGWVPREPVCFHVFAETGSFLDGLETIAGMDRVTARSYIGNFGLASEEAESGWDAVYLNVAVTVSANWIPFLTTHEYFHIVQANIGGAGNYPDRSSPWWFLEGVADWEAAKLQGPPFPIWLDIVRGDEQRGVGIPLDALVIPNPTTGDHTSAGYVSAISKARAAAMLLEDLSGPQAAADILRANKGGSFAGFEAAFQQVTGFDLGEFESRLDDFLLKEGEAPS